jgi:5-methylcytosine-specific restriction protein A
MPLRPPQPCQHPGCHVLTTARYCHAHRAQAVRVDHRKQSAHQRGYTKEWSRQSRQFLQRNPICCGHSQTCFAPATCTDHITPHRGNPALFWDELNWQPLCAACHSRKTASEDGGFGNALPSPTAGQATPVPASTTP